MTVIFMSAEAARDKITALLVERGLTPPERWLLVERGGLAWLIGVLPALPRLAPYIQRDVTHSLSTALGGLPVIVSNSTGLRYAVLLSERPTLPESVPFPPFPGPDEFAIGAGYRGHIFSAARAWQNMLVGGGQGSGKSTFLRVLTHTARAHGWDIYLADPDGHTYGGAWERVIGRPVASSGRELGEVLELIEAEIARRAALFQAAGGAMPPEDIDDYNQRDGEKIRRVLVAVDEANSYMGDKETVRGLGEAARRGRKWGVHLVLAAHNWRAKDVSRELSSMLQTRVCFRVADDTAGGVALDSRHWGLHALSIQRPGRAVLRLGGQYQPVQTYLLDAAQEAEWLAGPAESSALTEIERELVRLAVESVGGQFKIKRLAELSGMSEWSIRTTAEKWERRGWLTHPADAVSARRVSAELMNLAGISAQDAQAS